VTIQQTVEQLQVTKNFCFERHPTSVVYDKRGLTVLCCMQHRVGKMPSFFSSRRNWDSPNPSPAGECAPHPLGSGGRVGRVPISTRGQTLWYSLYICTLWYAGRKFRDEYGPVPACPLKQQSGRKSLHLKLKLRSCAFCIYCMYWTRINDRIE
jgi:hypothetical protein